MGFTNTDNITHVTEYILYMIFIIEFNIIYSTFLELSTIGSAGSARQVLITFYIYYSVFERGQEGRKLSS
jgi:hypothetical protein